MTDNLTAITASHLRADEKAEKKKSMLSRLAPEAAKLFDLLSAKDWKDSHPKMNRHVKNLVSDRDPQRAKGLLHTTTKSWAGEFCDKGLIAFLGTGYAAADIQASPGGFTIFMFRPISAFVGTSRTDRRLQVKSMFGSTELDDEAIKYYAESDFFLPQSLADLEEQIYTCIKALELFTSRQGIAVEGYVHGMEMIRKGRRVFKHLLKDDPLFAVKFAYLLDRVFQNFVDKLGDYYSEKRPIETARRSLEGFQVSAIERAMIGFEVGAAPRLFLPSSLRGNQTDALAPGRKADQAATKPDPDKSKEDKRGKEAKKSPKEPNPEWWTKNPSPVKDWLIPEGKRFHDFFSSQDHKENLTGWPKLPPHTKPDQKPKRLCLKYQVLGECLSHCFGAHAIPSTLDAATHKLIDEKFKLTHT
jgi:hypothetical protein